MDETYGTFVDDECLDFHDYDDTDDDDTDDDTEDILMMILMMVGAGSSQLLFLSPWPLVLKIRPIKLN